MRDGCDTRERTRGWRKIAFSAIVSREPRLAPKHHRSAEGGNITLKEY